MINGFCQVCDIKIGYSRIFKGYQVNQCHRRLNHELQYKESKLISTSFFWIKDLFKDNYCITFTMVLIKMHIFVINETLRNLFKRNIMTLTLIWINSFINPETRALYIIQPEHTFKNQLFFSFISMTNSFFFSL